MSERRTHDWRELCLEAVSESDPERRMAIVVELGRILRNDVHEFGSLRVDVGQRQVTQNGKPVCLTQLEAAVLQQIEQFDGATNYAGSV